MTEIDELAAALRDLACAFDGLGTRWAIGGSLASAAHGEPRSTNDVDVVAELDEAQARNLTRALAPSFHVDADSAVRATRDQQRFNVIDERSFIKVDIFVPAPGPLGLGQLDRRVILELLPGISVPVLSAEDILLQKLRWFEVLPFRSPRQ